MKMPAKTTVGIVPRPQNLARQRLGLPARMPPCLAGSNTIRVDSLLCEVPTKLVEDSRFSRRLIPVVAIVVVMIGLGATWQALIARYYHQ